MAEPGWPRHALDVGIVEFRRSVRALWQSKGRFAIIVLGMLFPTILFAVVVVAFADAIRGIETIPGLNQFRGTIALFWLFDVFLIGQRVVSVKSRIDAESLLLTSVSPRTVAGGLFVAECLRIVAYMVVPVIVLTGIAVFLLDSVASLVLLPVAALCFATTAVVTASVCGYAIAWLVATSRFVARHKTLLGSVASLVGMGAYVLVFYPQIGGVSQDSLAWLPIAWVVDLSLVGSGLGVSAVRSAGTLLGSVCLVVVGCAILERQTTALWYTTPVSVDTDSDRERTERDARRDPLSAAVAPLMIPRIVSDPVRRVAEWTLLRTRRDPNRLLMLLVPLFVIVSTLVNVGIQTGSVDALAPLLAAVALPWFVGSIFATNPLGDEGAVLPVTLTAVSGTRYVRGLVVPGLTFGLPIVLVATGVAGVFSPYTLLEWVGLVVLGGYLTCVGVTITPAIGMAFPRFSAIQVGQSRAVVPPRMSAMVVHTLLTVVPGSVLAGLIVGPETTRGVLAGLVGFLPGLVLEVLGHWTGVDAGSEWFVGLGEGMVEVDIVYFQGIGGGLLLLGGVLVSALLYRNAIRRFERFSPS